MVDALLRLGMALLRLVRPVADHAPARHQLGRDLGNRSARLESETRRHRREPKREPSSMLGPRPVLSSGENLSKSFDTSSRPPPAVRAVVIREWRTSHRRKNQVVYRVGSVEEVLEEAPALLGWFAIAALRLLRGISTLRVRLLGR